MIDEKQKKRVQVIVDEMKNAISGRPVIDVLQDWAESSLTATWGECEAIVLAAYQLGVEESSKGGIL